MVDIVWSHTYTDWDEIESPAPHGEDAVHGLNLDWKRLSRIKRLILPA
ncbi:beta-galactosidase [Bacillus licheniformis]|nr:beta-galactosidase [Bacillus licheniformis]